jgi:hypothetical protein
VPSWQTVSAPGRRRKMFYDGAETLAVMVASPSDLDDLLPMLTAFQIEWNKIHRLLEVPAATPVPLDAARLQVIWGPEWEQRLAVIGARKKRLAVRMLGGALLDYERAALRWWWDIVEQLPTLDLNNRPVYFVSSNTHSLVNLLSGFALRNTDELLHFIQHHAHDGLVDEYRKIVAEEVPSSLENFLYYIQKKYQATAESAAYFARRADEERQLGIHRISSRRYLDVDAQVIEIAKLDAERVDPRIRAPGWERLARSEAVLVNIDYPLGLAAYHILKIIARSVGALRGVYVIGKAATLNGKIGDVLLPNEVYDEHTASSYRFAPALSAADIAPYLAYGSVLDNQKALTVRGTFLQNEALLDAVYRDFFTDLEMEAGPYLAAVYEQMFADRYPIGQHVSLLRPPYDLAFLHYASDTPASKGQNLGTRNLSYFGMDPTYATSLAVARRVVQLEMA